MNHPFDESYFGSGAYARVSSDRFSQYRWSNRLYAPLVREHRPDRGNILEVGCDPGHLPGWLAKDYRVRRTDINAWALSQVHRNVPEGPFLSASADDLRIFRSETFQIVIAQHMVEHLARPERAISEIARVMTPRGLLILATPKPDSPMRNPIKENWIGYKDRMHSRLKPPEAWLALLRGAGLVPRRIFSDGFRDPPYIPVMPVALQKILFGAPGGLQAILGWSIIPVRMDGSLIVLAEKE